MALIRAKQEGRPPPGDTGAERPSNVVNLMDALRRSLGDGGKPVAKPEAKPDATASEPTAADGTATKGKAASAKASKKAAGRAPAKAKPATKSAPARKRA